MWEYTVTTATSVGATQISSSQAGTTTSSTTFLAEGGATGSESYSSFSESIAVLGPWETVVSFAGQSGLTQDGVTITGNFADRYTHGFTSSESRYTSANTDGVTTSSSSETGERSLDSYIGGTQATTVAAAVEYSTTQETTRTVATGTTGHATTATTQTITRTTSSSSVGAANATIYATVDETTLAAPVRRVGVTEMEASEQAWEVTATHAAGWPVGLGDEFTARTGTQGTSSMVAPICGETETFSATGWNLYVETLTLSTTATTSTADTFAPWQSVLPATDTTTRSFALLTTVTTQIARLTYRTVGATQVGRASDYGTATQLAIATETAQMLVTINLSPTETTTALMHVTYRTATALPMYRLPRLYASSSSTSAAASESGSYTTTQASVTEIPVTGTHTSTTTEGTSSNTETNNYLFTTTTRTTSSSTYEYLGFGITLETCAIPGPTTSFASSSTDFGGGITHYEYRNTVHNAPEMHTISAETWNSQTWTYTETATTYVTDFTTTFSTTTETFETYATTATATTSQSTESTSLNSSESGETLRRSVSVTYAQRYEHVTYDASVQWTAHQLHPRNGFRVPGYLAASLGDGVVMKLSADSSFYFPYVATQSDVAGPLTPIVDTVASTYSTGSSLYTAIWDREQTRMRFSSAERTTYTTTAVIAAETQTVTRNSTVNSTTGTLSILGYTEQTWYEAGLSSQASQGSRVGGLAAKSDYAAGVFLPGGVRHWTRQSEGTTTSEETTWQGGAEFAGASYEGYAMPTRAETVRGAVAMASFAQVTGSGGSVIYPFGRTEGIGVQIVRPMVSLSRYPNL